MRAKATQISADDVRQALERFQSAGGLIEKLPDQPSPSRRMVGGKWGMYEPVMEGLRASPASAE